jgi:hypothetical protein
MSLATCGVGRGLHLVERAGLAVAVEHGQLGRLVWVAHRDPRHERSRWASGSGYVALHLDGFWVAMTMKGVSST